MRTTVTAILAFLALFLAPAASAVESPTPYDVTTVGIQLPEGDTFQAHGHVNVRWVNENNREHSAGIHFDPNNGHPGGQWIGQSFIPWSAFGIPDGAQISWVQVHGYNEHFGENGQKWVPVTPKPQPQVESRERVEETPWTQVEYSCETGTLYLQRIVTTIGEARESSFVWDPIAMWWAETWGEWTLVESDEQLQERTETFDPETHPLCEALPPTGAPLTTAGILAGLVVLGGAALLAVRTRLARKES